MTEYDFSSSYGVPKGEGRSWGEVAREARERRRDERLEGLVCRGTHLGRDKFLHEPAPLEWAFLGGEKAAVRCVICGAVILTREQAKQTKILENNA